MNIATMTPGGAYDIACRQRRRRGSGFNLGSGTVRYEGFDEATGKHEFYRGEGTDPLYLDADEITTMAPR